MPSFDEMKKLYPNNYSSTIGQQLKDMSNMVYDEVFTNTTTYRVGKIYDNYMNEILDVNGNPIELEFRFVKTKTFSVGNDVVEYWVQFKTGVNPEIDFDTSEDQHHRLGYYIDIWDDNTKEIKKWLIVGKDQSEFDRYNVLECNWLFEWLDHDRNYHKCLGCLRNQNSYNSGIWASDFSTSVEDQMKFIVPANDETKTIDYNIRFMLSDNNVYPKTYEISKVLDTFPIGTIQCTLAQTLYNMHTDLCRVVDVSEEDCFPINDGKMHRVCDFNKSSIKPDIDLDTSGQTSGMWTLDSSSEKLYVYGYPQVVTAIPEYKDIIDTYRWRIFIDNEDIISKLDDEYTGDTTDTFIDNYFEYKSGNTGSYYLQDYFDIFIDDENHTFTIKAINKNMANYIIKIAIDDDKGNRFDAVEMEVVI